MMCSPQDADVRNDGTTTTNEKRTDVDNKDNITEQKESSVNALQDDATAGHASTSNKSTSSESDSQSSSSSSVVDNNHQQEQQGQATITTSTDKRKPVNPCWTSFTTQCIHHPLRRFCVILSKLAAQNPYTTIGSVMFLSFALIITGFFTNFTIVYNHEVIFTPFGSLPELHHQWIVEESGFDQLRPFYISVHQDGDNILNANAVRHLFDALTTLQSTPGYDEACQQSSYRNRENQPTCRLSSATQFWQHNRTLLELALSPFSTIEDQDDYIVGILSNRTFPDGTPVFHEAILGNYQMTAQNDTHDADDYSRMSSNRINQNSTTDNNNNNNNNNNRTTVVVDWQELDDDVVAETMAVSSPYYTAASSREQQQLTAAQSLIIKLDLPNLGEASDDLEKRILARMEDLRQTWQSAGITDSDDVTLEYFTMYAYLLEFERAVYSDIFLVVLMMFIMVGFCCAVFYRHGEKVQSRAMMGVFSIATIGMSLMTGYGIVWCIGVPFTNIAMMVPFIVVGVGLDDTFIITGAYFRTCQQARSGKKDTKEDIIERVEATMDEVGLSISLTTLTTTLAFILGCISSIPAIRWLCIYGAVCISVDFIYQITFFISWMVLDEQRVQANRKDCCVWIVVDDEDEEDKEEEKDDTFEIGGVSNDGKTESANAKSSTTQDNNQNFSERFMGWYADKLLHPVSKVFVLVFFAVYLGGCIYSTTLLTQEFKVESYVPKGSHVKTFFQTFEAYSSLFRPISVYFRNVNQSSPEIQQAMLDYVDDLSVLPAIGGAPEFFWLRDFAEMSQQPEFAAQAEQLGLVNSTLEEQLDVILQIPQVRDVYQEDIVRDPTTGEILASRCYIYLRKVDMNSIPNQIDILMDQREVTAEQPVNQDAKHGEWSFFTFDDLYFYWELYSVSVDELIFTTISGVVAVSVVAFVIINHWSAVLFVTPLIIMLYFMLLGTMQYSGIHINAVTYVIIVIAIGLLVDFLMHMLLRYYETTGTTRHEKVKETLCTMGSSILLGGLTTFLGVIPLSFSTTTIFMVVFKSFLAMVCLGCGVGLILLPVLLSLVGPINTTTTTVQQSSDCDAAAFKTKPQDISTAMFSSPGSYADWPSDEDLSPRSASSPKHLQLVMTSSAGDGYEHIIDV